MVIEGGGFHGPNTTLGSQNMSKFSVMLSSQVPPKETVGLAQLAESAGFARLWLTEDYYRKAGFASCGAVLGSTSNLSVGLECRTL